jgi:hypothetical protein
MWAAAVLIYMPLPPLSPFPFSYGCSDFLCPLNANTYGIDFLSFKIRDMDTQHIVFEVRRSTDTWRRIAARGAGVWPLCAHACAPVFSTPLPPPVFCSLLPQVAKDSNAAPVQYPENFDYNQLRSINYKFPAQFLRYETVGTTYEHNSTDAGTGLEGVVRVMCFIENGDARRHCRSIAAVGELCSLSLFLLAPGCAAPLAHCSVSIPAARTLPHTASSHCTRRCPVRAGCASASARRRCTTFA